MMASGDDAAARLIRRALTDLGCAEIEPAVEAAWAARYATGAGFSVMFELVRSLPAQTSFVKQCYRRILGRNVDPEIADPEGVARHVADLAAGAARLQKIAEFISSDEFFWQRCGENNSLFVSLVGNELSLQSGDVNEAELEHALTAGTSRAALVSQLFQNPVVKRRVALTIFNGIGIERPDAHQFDTIAAQTEFFTEMVIALVLAAPAYTASAAVAASNIDHHARRFADAHAERFFGQHAADRLRAAGAQAEFAAALGNGGSLPALLYRFATQPGILDDHWDLVGVSFAADQSAVASPLPAADRGGPRLTASSHFEAPAGVDRFSDWQTQFLPHAARIVGQWIARFTIAGFNEFYDAAAVHQFWTRRLALNEYYVAVLCEFLAAPYCLGVDARSLSPHLEELNRAPGSLTLPMPARAADGADRPGLVATSFFYWYDIFDSIDFLRSPDGPPPPSADHLALTLKPADFNNFSYQLTSWHAKELADMAEAGIDVVLPVFFGTPFSDEHVLANAHDIERNRRNRFSDVGLRVLRQAWRRLQRSGVGVPKIAMFFDTSSLTGVNAKGLRVNYLPFVGPQWFYETIRNFYSHLPAEMWACRDGRPLIFIYHPSFGSHPHPDVYPFVRECFRRDFGVDPFIVTAAEEEAPRVSRAERLEPWVERMSRENTLDVLADLLAEDELYAHCGADDRRFADFLGRQVLGNEPDAGSALVTEPLADRAARRRFTANLIADRRFSGRIASQWSYRMLRRKPRAWDEADRKLAATVEDRLARDRDWWGALALLLQSPQFAATAGGTDEYVIDWICQCVVMKCPNPECPNGSTTSTDTAGKDEFLAACRTSGRSHAIGEFLNRPEVRQALVSEWFFSYWAWDNPGPADSAFYWSAAISPCVRDVASIGPGYDQSAIFSRPQIYMPRHDGATYAARWQWLLAMQPRPWMVHLESWNEFFEGTNISDTAEFGRKYIEMTRHYADRYHSNKTDAEPEGRRETPAPQDARNRQTAQKPTLEQILTEISWWQKWEIVPGVFTPGPHDVQFLLDNLQLPASMEGARVLDIGGWNGAFAFECERRKAAEVIMLEPTPLAATGFDRTKAFLESNVEWRSGTIYDLDPERFGHFDIVLCLGVIYHLRYPLLGLDNIRRVCRGELFVESAILDTASWTPNGVRPLDDIGTNLRDLPFLQFFDGAQYFDDSTNWFVPNAVSANAMIEAAGFEVLASHVDGRYFSRARVRPGQPPMFRTAHEGIDYDTHARHLLGPPDRWASPD